MSKSNKTLNVNIDGKEVSVADLPKSIRDNVDMFDNVRDKIDQLAYELNILHHAGVSLNSRILIDAAEYIKAVQDSQKVTDTKVEVEDEPTKKANLPQK